MKDTLIGHYQIIEKIGGGRMVEVNPPSDTNYHCEDRYGIQS
jgi:hypothetical protein